MIFFSLDSVEEKPNYLEDERTKLKWLPKNDTISHESQTLSLWGLLNNDD
jgi:hypothetical protein